MVKNNLGFGALVKGDMSKAEEYFNSMTAATPESKWGLGVIAITKGEYDKAVNYFGTEPCFNLALALYLKGDVTKAKANSRWHEGTLQMRKTLISESYCRSSS